MRRMLAAGSLAASALLLTACTGTPSPAAGTAAAARPNVVFVLTDDLAWNLVAQKNLGASAVPAAARSMLSALASCHAAAACQAAAGAG